MEYVPYESDNDISAYKAVSFMAKMQEMLQEILEECLVHLVILALLQCASILYLSLQILEIIYGAAVMPALYFLWIIDNSYRIGVIPRMFGLFYEEFHYWRRL